MNHTHKNFPDFIIAGCAKSGTTALHHMLDQHPDIFMSIIKESNYFIYGYELFQHHVKHNGLNSLQGVIDSDICDTPEKYEKLFAPVHDKQMLGESSPWYLMNHQVPTRIRDFNPSTKIILILRNPTDVVFANFVHQVREGSESLKLDDFKRIFEDEHYINPNLHPFSKHLEIPKYSTYLPAFIDAFPEESILVFIYEEFLNDKQAALAKVFSFIGVDNSVKIEVDKKVNVSGMPQSKTIQRILQGNSVLKRLFATAVPQKPRNKIRARIEAINTKFKPMLNRESRQKLDALYLLDRQYVEKLLKRKVEVWPSSS